MKKLIYIFLCFASFLFILLLMDTPQLRLAIALLLNVNVIDFDWFIVLGYIPIPIILFFLITTIFSIPYLASDLGKFVSRINNRVYNFFQAKLFKILFKSIYGLWIMFFLVIVVMFTRAYFLYYRNGYINTGDPKMQSEQKMTEHLNSYNKYQEVFSHITEIHRNHEND